jgi:uncharacterized protein
MIEKSTSNVLGYLLLSLGIAIGLIAGCLILGSALKQFRMSGRYVTVKGLAERDVVADVAVWKIRFKAADNDLATANTKALSHINTVQTFLLGHGIKSEEIDIGAPRVIDLFAREYGPERTPPNRYIIEAMVGVKTNNVSNIQMASRKAIDLIKAGIVLDEAAYGTNPSYIFTKLNDFRPAMLAEATKSARTLAEQFAADSGSKVGPIRQANQGVFTIGGSQSDEGGGQETATVKKRLRVVTTIDYFLID